MSTDYRWEWTLRGGVKVAATLDPAMRIESVFVAGRLVSQAERGRKPEGHTLSAPAGTVVKFQERGLICILRVDGEEVSPDVWPVRKRAEVRSPSRTALPLGPLALALVLVALAAAALFALRSRPASHPAGRDVMTAAHRADNGRFVAHFPATFAVRPAVLPSGTSGIVLEEPERADAIVIVAAPDVSVAADAWIAQKRLHGEALANLPRGAAGHEETARREETCSGQPGAVIAGRVKSARGDAADVWSCAFVHDGVAYLFMYGVREDATSEDIARLRRIVEATELTHLAEIGGRTP